MDAFYRTLKHLKRLPSALNRGLTVIGMAGLFFSSALKLNEIIPSPVETWSLGEVSDTGIVIEFNSPGYDIHKVKRDNQEYDAIVMAGALASTEISMPEVPVFSTLIGVPAGATLSLEIVGDQNEQLPGSFKLAPILTPQLNQELLGLAENTLVSRPIQPEIQFVQTKDGLFPDSPAKISPDAWLRDQRIVRISVYPFQYNQTTGRLTWHRSLRLFVRYSEKHTGLEQNRSTAVDNPFENELEHSLLNYQSARLFRGIPMAQTNIISANHQNPELTENSASISKYRVSVKADGLYRLNYATLSQAGLPAQPLSFANLKISSQGRMVSYEAEDLDHDSVFDPGDAIVFYGQKFYGDWMTSRYAAENANWLTYSSQLSNGSWTTWKPAMNAEMLEKYTDENVYWLDFNGTQPASNTQTSQSKMPPSLGAPKIEKPNYLPWISRNTDQASFPETIHIEPSLRSRFLLFNGEDTWYWDQIKFPDPNNPAALPKRTYSINLPDPVSNQTTAHFSGEIAATSSNETASPDHHIQIYLNDPQNLNPIVDATWDGISRFHFDAYLPQSRLVNGDNRLDLVVSLTPNLYSEDLYLDWFQFDYNRKYIAHNNNLTIKTNSSGFQTFRVKGLSGTDIGVYDITNPLQPVQITGFVYDGSNLRFTTNVSPGGRFYVGKADPVVAGNVSLKTFDNYSTPADYIFITPSAFLSALQPLVNYRGSQGFSTLVVDIDQLYNQFNDGILNPIAIKNFLAYTFANWQTPPSYVLLVGDGHWNFKNSPNYGTAPNYMPPFLNWVDPWQGEVDSANLLGTIVGSDPLADVMIGRMPVNSAQELTDIISKTISYEQAPPGTWKNRLLFVADNTSSNPPEDFVTPTEHIISGHVSAGYTPVRLYLDSFIPGSCTANQPCPAATQALENELNQNGAFLLNYTGHGAINLWASEQILTTLDVSSLTNGAKLPVMLSMTCLDGYWIHPNLGPALAEVMLRSANSGAVATFSPTGLGLATGHETLQAGFYDALFKNGTTRLGAAASAAKLNLFSTGYNYDLLHTFTIFGDPALRMFTP